jgi:endonuclease YncB( thermonuclease family)
MADTIYFYKAYVEKVYDGDTITCTIDCGFALSMKTQKIRLYGAVAADGLRVFAETLNLISTAR